MKRWILGAMTSIAVAAPAFSQGSATPATPLAVGETFTLRSEVLGEVRRINVYAPPSYQESLDSLPVLYMLDGGLGEDFLHVAGLVQVLVGNGGMRPFLLVGIENTQRRRDLTGPTEQEQDRRLAPEVGGSARFRRFIRSELMPAVRTRYRTRAETAIVGESFAGLFVVETYLLEPDLFHTYLAFDPSVWWNDGFLLRNAEALLRQGTRPGMLSLTTSSQPEIRDLTRRLAGVLGSAPAQRVRWRHIDMPNETHATIYHPAALESFRAVLAAP